MDGLHDLLTTLHLLNRWLVVTTGALGLGITVAALAGARPFRRAGRRSLWAFLATLVAQAVLGVLIAATAPSDSEPFDGSTATLVWHALGGLFALAFTATALIRSRRRSSEWAAARAAVMWVSLGVISVGDVVVGIVVAALVTLARLVTARRITPAGRRSYVST